MLGELSLTSGRAGRRRRSAALAPTGIVCVELLEDRVLLSAMASLVSKTVADHAVYFPGTSFTQTFSFKNTGDKTWTGYSLVFVSASDRLGATTTSFAIPTTAPGATVKVSVPLVANKTGGSGAAQIAYWQIKNGSSVIPISGTSYNNAVAKDKVWTSITIDAPNGTALPHLTNTGYVSAINPYLSVGNGGQCTAYAWGRAYEVLGISLKVSGGAGKKWIESLKGTYSVDMTPAANSVAVWSGHVAYVESVTGSGSNSTILLTEANWSSHDKYADLNDPKNNPDPNATSPWWGGGFDGNTKSFTPYQMTTRGQAFLGYIHLAAPPATPSGLTATATGSTSVFIDWGDVAGATYKLQRWDSAAGTWKQIYLSSTSQYNDSGSHLQPGTTYYYRVAASNSSGDSAFSPYVSVTTQPARSQGKSVFVSDLAFVSEQNGWGAVERDRSNGETGAADGHTLTLNGVTYPRGLGTHSYSNVRLNLDGRYTRFESYVGVDDESGSNGSVVFRVVGDGRELFNSGVMRGNTATSFVSLDTTGIRQLQLIVDDAGDGGISDHADWADAKLILSPQAGSTIYASDLYFASETNGWGAVERDRSNGGTGPADGQIITMNGVTYGKGMGVHSYSNVTLNLNGRYSSFASDVGLDDECGTSGTVRFKIYGDGRLLFDSGNMNNSSQSKRASVDVRGVRSLQLVVEDAGDGGFCDHADWADARLILA